MEYFAFQWHITDSCDQRCEHCYIFSEGHPKLIEMSFPKAAKVVDDCVDMCRRMNRLPYFYITGGDPILHSRFLGYPRATQRAEYTIHDIRQSLSSDRRYMCPSERLRMRQISAIHRRYEGDPRCHTQAWLV